MSKASDRNLLIIIGLYAITQIVYLITEYVITRHQFGVPLDDTWIHFRFARNLAHGYFLQYNISEATPGTTCPFWIMILSIPFLFSEDSIILFSKLLSSIFFLLTLIELYRLSRRLGFDDNYSLLITALTTLCGRLLWSSLSGMEITLICYLSVLVSKQHLRELETTRIYKSTGLLLGLAVVTRPETYLLALLYYSLTLILLRDNLKTNLINLIISLSVFALIALPYPIFCYIRTGGFLPNTYHEQVIKTRFLPSVRFLLSTGKMFVIDNMVIAALWLVSMCYFLKTSVKNDLDMKFLLVNLWVILLPAVSSIVAPVARHHGRYLIPLIPFIYIVSIMMLQKIFLGLEKRNFKKQRLIKRASLAVIILLSLRSAVSFAGILGWNVENVNDQQVKIGKWLKANLPEEETFGINDIGAIPFITKKAVVDMMGLATPEALKFRKMGDKERSKALLRLLRTRNVHYLIIYPTWFKYMVKTYSKDLEPIYSAKLGKNTICGGDEMFVFKIHWEKINLD